MKGKLPADVNSLFKTSTASEETLRLIKEWLKTCKGEKHNLCKLETEGLDDIPRRLLDVRPNNPRLYFPKPEEKGKLRYLCLSHCWGKGTMYKLTKDTMKDMETGVSVDRLPRNVTRWT